MRNWNEAFRRLRMCLYALIAIGTAFGAYANAPEMAAEVPRHVLEYGGGAAVAIGVVEVAAQALLWIIAGLRRPR